MLDANLIAALETSLHQTRNTQSGLVARLRQLESEAESIREEISELENTAVQTASAIDTLLAAMRSGNRSVKVDNTVKPSEYHRKLDTMPSVRNDKLPVLRTNEQPRQNTVAYMNQSHALPNRVNNIEPVSQRFSDRTITQACTLLLREAGKPLHVNELYHLLVAGGMGFKGNNPTISVAVSLNRNKRFRKVGPGTFDLLFREASQAAS